jgi:S-adenosylmethionine:tRNA ribosyltransferase-isomerase
VFNDTQVMRARLRGRRQPGGGKADVLLLSEREAGVWEALVTPGRRLTPGREIVFGDGELRAEVIERTSAGGRLLKFSGADDLSAALAHLGELPLPPYIHEPLRQDGDYQTAYARVPGASAAPTAGLHFTDEMMRAVCARVHGVAFITLHISLGTFRPIRTENAEEHDMHPESYAISEEAAELISAAKAEGRRVVAVGTSTARALEAATADSGAVSAGFAETDLFIRPGYRFRTVGALLTNFHMPRSTLLLLVYALAGRELALRAYQEAVERKYRFLSFGDAMLIM